LNEDFEVFAADGFELLSHTLFIEVAETKVCESEEIFFLILEEICFFVVEDTFLSVEGWLKDDVDGRKALVEETLRLDVVWDAGSLELVFALLEGDVFVVLE
jgi:hypothetical protein